MGDRVGREEIEKANEVHILDYLNSKGEPIVKQGNKYYSHADHDSLVFNENGKWYWNSRSTGGFGAISFAREFYNMKFQDAVRDVNNLDIQHSHTFKEDITKEFEYPQKYETKEIENAKKYLVTERGIDEKIVLALEKHGLIVEDKLKNIVFKWKDNTGKIVGADVQGTVPMDNKRGTYKKIMPYSKTDGGFSLDIGKPNKIAIFESAIDGLSYFDLKRPKDIRLFSMSGLKDQAAMTAIRELMQECYKRNEPLEKIIFAVDNDKAGKEFSQKWENVLGDEVLQFDIPIMKDWNEDLKKHRNKEKEKQQSLIKNQSQEIER